MPSKRTIKMMVLLLVLMGIGVVIGIYTDQYYRDPSVAVEIDNIFWPAPKQIGPFTMVDQDGNRFGVDDLKGKWTLMFFGYTHCPDVCPITMNVLDQVYGRITAGETDPRLQVVFVTVDPERDTLSQLSDYISYFNDDFIALGGSGEQLDSLAGQIGITYYYTAQNDSENYLVDHTSSVFLLDPGARLLSIFSAPHNVEHLHSEFIKIEQFIRNQG
jgi:protein SCO1/2